MIGKCDKGVTQIQTEALFVVGKVSEVQAIKAHPALYLFILQIASLYWHLSYIYLKNTEIN